MGKCSLKNMIRQWSDLILVRGPLYVERYHIVMVPNIQKKNINLITIVFTYIKIQHENHRVI